MKKKALRLMILYGIYGVYWWCKELDRVGRNCQDFEGAVKSAKNFAKKMNRPAVITREGNKHGRH